MEHIWPKEPGRENKYTKKMKPTTNHPIWYQAFLSFYLILSSVKLCKKN